MQIDKFLMNMHVIFGTLKGNHSQYRDHDVTDESVVSNVRVNVQLVTMGVKIYAVAKTCSVVVDVIFEIIGLIHSVSAKAVGNRNVMSDPPLILISMRLLLLPYAMLIAVLPWFNLSFNNRSSEH